jgi:hypothetical protein
MSKSSIKFITKNQYNQINECKCGGPVFKYHDSSKNKFVVKCGYFKKVCEVDKITKERVWITPKKISCDWKCIYNAERPIFAEINKGLIKTIEIKNKKNIHEQLEDKLKILFRFLHVSTHSSTIQEIDLLVKNNLFREPRKTFYYPTTTLFMKESHKESFEDYEKRIFSKKIIDLSYKIIPPKPVITNNYKNDTISSQFIVVTDDDDSDKNSECSENQSESERQESEEENDRDQSDFESIYDDHDNTENVEIVDYYDDCEDEYDYDYNDDNY